MPRFEPDRPQPISPKEQTTKIAKLAALGILAWIVPASGLVPVSVTEEATLEIASGLFNAAQSDALKLKLTSSGGTAGIANEGCWGINVEKGQNPGCRQVPPSPPNCKTLTAAPRS
jgi:transcription initiation factor TFIID subunit TAF12